MKIDKTEMAAVTKALQIYPKTLEDNMKGSRKVAQWLTEKLRQLPHINSVETIIADQGYLRSWPYIRMTLNEDTLGLKTDDVVNLLYDGEPCIWVYGPRKSYASGGIAINCQTLYHGTRRFPGNERLVFKRFREILTQRR
jgi:hypothetical protein